MATKRGKSKAKKAKGKKAKKFVSVPLTLDKEHLAYVQELAEYAGTSIEVVCSVMMACGIYKAKRVVALADTPGEAVRAESVAPKPEEFIAPPVGDDPPPDPNAPDTVYT
jgi:hypothetical protein